MKYWIYVNNEILGPYEKEKLLELPVFSAATLICPQTPVGEKTQDWKEAATYPEIAEMLSKTAPVSAPANDSAQPAFPPVQPDGPAPAEPSRPETGQPLFNSEMPPVKLKPLSLGDMEPVPNPAAPQTPGDASPVKKVLPKFTASNFDPMSLSRIDRKVEMPKQEPSPTDDISVPETPALQVQPEIPVETPLQAAPVPQAPEAQAPAPETYSPVPAAASVPEPSPAAQPEAGADKSSLCELNSRIEALARNAVTKQDLEPLKEKLNQMGEVLSSMKNAQFQREIMDKMQYLENALSDVKASLSQSAPPSIAAAGSSPRETARPSMVIERDLSGSSLAGPAEQQPAAAEADSPSKTDEPQPDNAEVAKPADKLSGIRGLLAKFLKPALILALLLSVLGGGALALKQFGIFDVTKFLPFQVPYLSDPPAEAPAPQPFQQPAAEGSTDQTGQDAAQTPAPAAEPVKADLSPEVIAIGKSHTVNTGGKTLERSLYDDASRRKGDYNNAIWQAKEISQGLFELSVTIPSKDKRSQLIYRYEIDHAKRTVKPLDGPSKGALGGGDKPKPAADMNRSGAKKPAAVKSQKPARAAVKPAARPKPVKAAQPEEDEEEYEYVDEDDSGGTEE